ncbi:MAG: hypothetical protein IJG52_08720 [Lachnospiraceae bacterium]|nr:hypothetical protein [Lachnospiraceae bacterium]MBQ3393479.1 hypothetical protein [Lachnospiraceae bacterium]
METEKRNKKSIILLLLLAAAPVLSGLTLWAVSGANPLHMDMWKTAWNDEVVYYRAVRLMRIHGLPQGVAGYNEVAPPQLSYGPYNIFTFIPYWLLSFVTGTDGHNYFCHANLILACAGTLLLAAFARPERRKAGWMILLFMTNLILARYTWSGMIETSYNFFLIVFTGLTLWIIHQGAGKPGRTAAMICLMILMVFFWSVMRPFYAALLLIPLCLSWKRGTGMGPVARCLLSLGAAAAGGAALKLYMYFGSHSVVKYFADAVSPTARLRELIGSRSLSLILQTVLSANLEGLREVKRYLLEANWIGAVTLLFYISWLLLLVLWIRSISRRENDGRVSAAFGMLLSGALIYEATIVLYSPIQLHRMLLAVTVACGILIIDLSDGRTLPFIQELAILGLMTFLVINRPSSYVVPQMDPTSITGTAQETEQAELAALLPLSEDPWDNTIAKEAEGENLEYAFLAPSWTAFNICQYDVLEEKLRTGTLQSRYVLLAEDSDLKKLCDSLCGEEKLPSAKDAGGKTGLGKAGTVENASKAVKLEQIWEKYGHVLYKVK